jgi:broad specificity phosphatase PhoE
MARLHLVRHAQAEAGWGDQADPGLSELGRQQADEMADRLAPVGPLPIMTSPLARARETAAALEHRWNILAVVDPGVGEVPSPSEDLVERHDWLRQALGSTWTALGPRYLSWRTMVTELLIGIPHDTVVVTHFVLINAALGRAMGRDEVVVGPVGNASVTVFENEGHELRLVEETEIEHGSVGPVL